MISVKNQLEDFIYRRIEQPRKQDVLEILAIFKNQTFCKGHIFKEKNTIINHLGFLGSGSVRSYFINDKGDEITNEVLLKDNFVSDIISIRTAAKSNIIIEVLEESDILVANMDEVWNLLNHNVTFNILIREHMGDRAMEMIKKQLLFLNGTAKERYQYIIKTNPEILDKFPLRYIANMIGVTQTQLSRIRKEKS